MAVFFPCRKVGHPPDLPDCGDDVAGAHGDSPVLFPSEDDEGAFGAALFRAVFPDDMHGGSKENEFVFGIKNDLACWRMRIGIPVQGKIPDEKVSSRRCIVTSQDLSSQDGDSADGKRLVAHDLGKQVRFLPGNENGGLGRKLIGTSGQDQHGQKGGDTQRGH